VPQSNRPSDQAEVAELEAEQGLRELQPSSRNSRAIDIEATQIRSTSAMESSASSQSRALSGIFISAGESEGTLASLLATGSFGRGMAALLNREGLCPGRSPSSNWSEEYQNLRDQAARKSSVTPADGRNDAATTTTT
jgi:hypothetical protein